MSSLAEIFLTKRTVVFKGIQEGGSLNSIPGFPITEETPCTSDFSNIYQTRFVSPFFLTFVHDDSGGPQDFFSQLDELFTVIPPLRWNRQLGVAHILGDNEVVMNETDGSYGRLIEQKCPCGKSVYFFYRTRFGIRPDGVFRPFVQWARAFPSSIEERDSTLPCQQVISP